MYNFYDKKVPTEKWARIRKNIKSVYENIPETSGCMENINKEGGCEGWCCQYQSPSLFYSEFLYTWKYIEGNWTQEKLNDLTIKCIENYLNPNTTKGCVFFDKENKTCQIHNTRPFNCRIYGQIPDDDFKPRYERLKVLYEKDPTAVIRYQCDLLTSAKPPTKEDINNWFLELTMIENRDLEIDSNEINDKSGGSYRQFHDHILLKFGSSDFFVTISNLRQNGTEEQKKEFIKKIQNKLQEATKKSKESKKENK